MTEEIKEQQQEQQEENKNQQQPESPQAKNFRELRESNEKLQRERDEAIRYAKQIENNSYSKDEDFSINPDDLAEGKHLLSMQNKVKKLEAKIKENEARSQELMTESKITAKFSDFYSVVTKENLEELGKNFPEVAETIVSSNDLYSKKVAAYTMIKKLQIAKDPELIQEQNQIQKNINKPRSLSSIAPQQGDSPLSRANAFENGLTPELAESLRKEMFEARKRM